ncbi:MAG: hypothetical protein NTX65_12190 [Ignavibacteriales bacterium]|nr:hypothetical protein [Ignavibacteriales bacterium]
MNIMLRTNLELENFLSKKKISQIILIPPMRLYDNGLTISIVPVELDTEFEPSSSFNGDIWKLTSNKFSLTRNALDKIATAARIKFSNSRMLSREVNDDGRVIYIKHQIQYELLCTDGSNRSSSTTGEYNYHEDLSRFRFLEDIIHEGVIIHKKGDLNIELVERRRNNSGSFAEGNAKSKALGEVFSEIKKSFTLEELQIPILVGRVVVDIEDILLKNPELKSHYAAKLLDISNLAYNLPLNINNKDLLSSASNRVNNNVSNQILLATKKRSARKNSNSKQIELIHKKEETNQSLIS